MSIASPDSVPPSWQRLLALSGVAFALLLLFGWFLSGGDAPNYTATDQDWTAWADDNSRRSGIGAFLILLAGSALLHFAGTIRSVLGTAETTVRGSVELARVAFAGALVGAVGVATAIVMVSAATSEGADADPVVSRAVTAASAGPYLVAAMGFAALLGSAGLSTLRSGVYPRWTGFVALIGAVAFLITFLTLIAGTGEDSVFGYGLLPGILARDLVDRYEHRPIPSRSDQSPRVRHETGRRVNDDFPVSMALTDTIRSTRHDVVVVGGGAAGNARGGGDGDDVDAV